MKTSWFVYCGGGLIVCVVALYGFFTKPQTPGSDTVHTREKAPETVEESTSSANVPIDTPVAHDEVVPLESSTTPAVVSRSFLQETVVTTKTPAVKFATATTATHTPISKELVPIRIHSIEPSEGSVDTAVTLQGEDLAGGDDLSVWMVYSEGAEGYLQASRDEYVKIDANTLLVTIPEYLCTSKRVDEADCTSYRPIQPGNYALYVTRDGQVSNRVAFIVTGADCAGLTESVCYQTPGCGGMYGPSECSDDICTADESFQGCYTLPPRQFKEYEALFADVAPPPLIYTTTQEWPPVVDVASSMNADCPIGKDVSAEVPTYTTEEVRGDTTYCVTMKAESAAGSTYATYTYIATRNSARIRLWFALRFTNCDGYADDRVGEACKNERETFDLTDYIDSLVRPVWGRLE